MPTLVGRFARFAVVGVVATVTHMAVFTAGIELARIEPVLANAIAFCVALVVGYALNRRWTFALHAEHGRLWRYGVAALIGLGASSAVMYVAVHVARWSPYVGVAISIVLVPPLSFALNQFWVFRARS
jgi:putative flippase GtrA